MVRKKTRIALITFVVLSGILLSVFFAYQPYITLAYKEFKYGFASLGPTIRFFTYWVEYYKQLRYNPEKGTYDFEWVVNDPSSLDDLDDYALGVLAWHRGDFTGAVSYLEGHHSNEGVSERSLFWLAMSYVRLAETENCLNTLLSPDTGTLRPAHQKMCTLPLTMYHTQTEYSRLAADVFQRLLDEYDDENRLYRWLLNFCYMTVGGFPEEVPPQYLVQGPFIDHFYGPHVEQLQTEYAYLRFSDYAKAFNIDTFDAGKGVAVEDFDRDGYLDIIVGGYYTSLRFYRNDQGQGFTDLTEEVGLSQIKGTHLITAADYDNDGWMDLFVGRPLAGDPPGDYLLLRNTGEGRFEDVTVSVGLLPLDDEGQRKRAIPWASAWADVDNDGDLDLFVATLAGANPFFGEPLLPPRFYINEGGRFVDQTEAFGLSTLLKNRYLLGAAFGDYDNDGYPDLAVTGSSRGMKSLLKNIDGQRFEATDLIVSAEPSFMTSFVDINHDGLLDLFTAGAGIAEPSTTMAVFGEKEDAFKMGHSAIWVQQPDGRFEQRTDLFRDQMPIATMGSSFGDINNDGAYDFYLGTGSPEGWFILPNLMYIGELVDGQPTGYMTDISPLHGFGTVQKGHGIVFFDFDNDGDQDLYSSLGGMWPGDAWPNQFFVNESELTNTWTKVRLRGRRSNYYGVGARIKVVAETEAGTPIIRTYLMDNKTAFGSSPYLAHIGLANAVRIERVEVTWSGQRTPRVYPADLETLNILDENEGTATERP